jgi:diguanylate cyclase (GGDEF)-like protein/PAS domain S-box-containing protein
VPGLRRSGRAGREVLLAVAAATTVTLAAAWSFQLLGVASSQARAAVLIGQVQAPGLVNAVFAPLNGQRAVGAGVVPTESLITAELRELRSLGLGSADVAALTAATDRLFGAVHLVESKAQAGDHAGANAVAIREMVDAQSALTAEDGIVLARVGRASGTATAQARVGVLGLLIGTVVVVAGLLLVGGRRRGRARQAASAQFEALVYSSTDLIGVTNGEGVLTYASPSLHQALGSASELIWAERIHPEDLPVVEAALASIRATPDHAAHVEFKVRHHDGRSLTLEATVTNKLTDGELGGFLWNARDVSDRKALEDQLLRQALQDPLTGLANRVVLRDRLSNALARAARHHRLVGLLLFDLDGFKEINDDAGHAAGDAVLVEVASRLTRHLRLVDTVARLGGDEFAMVVDDLADETDVDGAAARVLEVLEEPITVGSRQFRVTASVGKVMCVGDQDPDEALRHADIAMYAAKAAGKARVVTLEPVMAERVQARLALAHDLDGAAASGQLVLHYQPTVDLDTGRIQGAEALLRWNHPTRGHLPPLAFIPLAEETGAILSLGRWVLNTACQRAARWRLDPAMASVRTVNVNVSGSQLLDEHIVADVRDALRSAGLAPGWLTLEITESVPMRDPDAVVAQLTALKRLGVSLAIDDFGTGYSSLAYLRRFPVDILKIDKSFVDNVAHQGSPLAKAIVNMGASLHMTTVAEGIEADDQAAALRELGCDIGQGFLYARPVPAADFETMVKEPRQPAAVLAAAE